MRAYEFKSYHLRTYQGEKFLISKPSDLQKYMRHCAYWWAEGLVPLEWLKKRFKIIRKAEIMPFGKLALWLYERKLMRQMRERKRWKGKGLA